MEHQVIYEIIEKDYPFLLDILGEPMIDLIEKKVSKEENVSSVILETGGENFDIHFDVNMAFEICNTVFGAVGFYRMLFKTEATERLAAKMLDLLNRNHQTSILKEEDVKKIVQSVLENSKDV